MFPWQVYSTELFITDYCWSLCQLLNIALWTSECSDFGAPWTLVDTVGTLSPGFIFAPLEDISPHCDATSNPIFGFLVIFALDLKPGWISSLVCLLVFCKMDSTDSPLNATPADLLTASMVRQPWPGQGLAVLNLQSNLCQCLKRSEIVERPAAGYDTDIPYCYSLSSIIFEYWYSPIKLNLVNVNESISLNTVLFEIVMHVYLIT